jgi:predicted DNA-binding transcriptional regulator AlpA
MRTDEFKERFATSIQTHSPTPPEQEVFLAYDQLALHGIPFTRVHLRRLISRGLFPPPMLLSPNRVAWKASDIAAWKASRPTASAA